jgi:hypothetical protein
LQDIHSDQVQNRRRTIKLVSVQTESSEGTGNHSTPNVSTDEYGQDMKQACGKADSTLQVLPPLPT